MMCSSTCSFISAYPICYPNEIVNIFIVYFIIIVSGGNKIQLTFLGTTTVILGSLVMLGYLGDSAWLVWIRDLEALPIGLAFAASAAALGFLYGISRGKVYSLIILVIFITGYLTDIHLPYQLMFLGLIISVTGLSLFVRFIKRYPRLSKDRLNNVWDATIAHRFIHHVSAFVKALSVVAKIWDHRESLIKYHLLMGLSYWFSCR